MQRVVVDLHKLRYLNCGLGQFCLHLGRALANAASDAIVPAFLVGRSQAHLVCTDRVDATYAWIFRKEKFVKYLRPILHRLLPRKNNCALWHCTDQFCKFWPMDPRVPVLLTIHDLIFLHMKSGRKVDRYMKILQEKVDRSQAIVTDSDFSASEIRQYLKLRDKPLHVIHCGTTVDGDCTCERPEFVPSGKFLFAIGTVVARKNFHVLVDLMRGLPEYCLIVAGYKANEYAHRMQQQVEQANLESRVILSGEITDDQRHWLYQNCEALLFPSVAEGFGLPVVEAMACGKPVFMSDRTSLPEVGGVLGFYWKSFQPAHMLDVFQRGMDAYRRQADYPNRLQEYARRFSWDRAAAEYMKLYEEIIAVTMKHGCSSYTRERAA